MKSRKGLQTFKDVARKATEAILVKKQNPEINRKAEGKGVVDIYI